MTARKLAPREKTSLAVFWKAKTQNFVTSRKNSSKTQQGISIIELITVLGIIAVFIGFAAPGFKELSSDTQNATNQLQGFIKRVRAKAVVSTKAYRIVVPDGTDSQFIAQSAINCRAAENEFHTDPRLFYELPSKVKVNPNFDLCFSSRGISTANATITLSSRDNSRRSSLEVGLAGSVMIHKE